MEKRCFKCGETKPISEYYGHPQMADGRLNKCKTCARRDASDHLKRKTATVDGLIAERERGREKYRRLYRGKAKRPNGAAKRWVARNPQKRKAHQLLQEALRTGRILKPRCCASCGAERRLHGHHDDYTKPLAVRWLCSPCHMLLHRKPIPF